MPSYKLTYFDGKGRAELTRLVFAAAGQEFVDERLSREDWLKQKDSTPLGQLPVLEVDGKKYGQSVSIATYAAKECGLLGSSNIDELAISQIVQQCQDFIAAAVKVMHEKDEAKKPELEKNFGEVVIPQFLATFAKLLKENATGFFVGSSLSLADLAVFAMTSDLETRHAGALDGHNDLKAFNEKVLANEKLKTYIDNRKPTPF